MFLSGNAQISVNSSGLVAVGTTSSLARLNIQPQLSEPGATNLLIGAWNTTGQGCISVGVHNQYSWIQTWNALPLYINRQGNNVIFCNQFTWGDVGIGYNITTPSAKLQVNGSIIASGTVTWSDIRLKKNLNKISLDTVLRSKISKIEPLTYEWDIDKLMGTNKSMDRLSKIDKDFYNSLQYGFSAQDIQKIFPELVFEDNTGTLCINYQGFIPILFKIVQDHEAKIELLTSEIETLKNDSCCCSKLKSLSIINGGNENLTAGNVLYQNSPNPFTASTNIKYSLSEKVNIAMINIYNMNGTQLKSIELHQKGDGSITINGGEFTAGMYLYALITDGQVIDTKRMFLTD